MAGKMRVARQRRHVEGRWLDGAVKVCSKCSEAGLEMTCLECGSVCGVLVARVVGLMERMGRVEERMRSEKTLCINEIFVVTCHGLPWSTRGAHVDWNKMR